MSNHPSEKDHSYKIRETVPPGSLVRLIHEVYTQGPLPKGTIIEVHSYTNAGFLGITLSGFIWVAGERCQYVCGISAGAVTPYIINED